MTGELTLGEYMRRLRRAKGWSLHSLSERTGLSYSHLSRVENDSVVPNPKTVVSIAEALEGDLAAMLEMADCLPRQILDRLMSQAGVDRALSLGRTAGLRSGGNASEGKAREDALSLAVAIGIPKAETAEAVEALLRFLRLGQKQRRTLAQLMEMFQVEEDGRGR
jgi:transcriptional regulator with XRE-family HTH domain